MAATADALYSALAHQRAGRLEQAESIYRQVLEREPDNCDAIHLLGLLAHQAGHPEAAAAHIARAVALNPAAAFYHNNLGIVLQDLGRLADAVLCYQEALRLNPDYTEAYNNLGFTLQGLERDSEALACYREALARNPHYAEAYNNLGNAFLKLGYAQEAIDSYCQALRLKPNPDGFRNLGNALLGQGRFEEALACYDQVLSLAPEDYQAHWNRALLFLLDGQFERGWQEYEWRWKQRDIQPRCFPQPAWDGGPLNGRTILLYAEQGLGDTLQFIRYAPRVKEAGGRVVVECQARLLPLLAGYPGVDDWVETGSAPPPVDLHAALLSLPRLFHTDLSSIPAAVPLAADPARAAAWRKRIPPGAVGLCWAGSSTHKNNRNRSLTLDQFAPLARIPGLKLVSLQRGPEMAALAAPPPGLHIFNAEEQARDILDSAAIIANLDLVITVDTLVAHLAAGLGKPVWNLVGHLPDWRWLLGRPDSPWYPTMRLFRQPRPGDWPAVIEAVAEALRG